uniref:Uncharacterized protein n=1 Tax=Lepeophtheirus salmonis TaxID=72036 RepID=A0A0K2U3Q0_LEPSM
MLSQGSQSVFVITLITIIFTVVASITTMDQGESLGAGSLCFSYKCLKSISNPNILDSICRRREILSTTSPCYCCGGFKYFHIYGDICLRYCLKTQNPATKKISGEPCRPKNNAFQEKTLDKEFDAFKFFPDFPLLLPEDQLDCRS